jgi:hypothetical protein
MRTLPLLLVALVLTGCSGTQQGNAESALEARIGDADVSCTRAARVGYLQELDTKQFLCLARRATGNCDRYRVSKRERRYAVTLLERHGDCVLPPS